MPLHGKSQPGLRFNPSIEVKNFLLFTWDFPSQGEFHILLLLLYKTMIRGRGLVANENKTVIRFEVNVCLYGNLSPGGCELLQNTLVFSIGKNLNLTRTQSGLISQM